MRLIQLSDCHLLAQPDSLTRDFNTHESLRQCIAHIKSQEKADAFIFTGDISQDGSAESYQQLSTLMGFTRKPLYALPGNHDNAATMRAQLNANCAHNSALGRWQIILLDSQVEGEAWGEVGEADLNWLTLCLKTSTDKPTLVAVHHQPIPVGSQWTDDIGLQNGDQLLNLLKDYRHVKGLIFGHVHQAFDTQFEHIRILGCPSSCFQFKAGIDEFCVDETLQAGYRWLELGDKGELDTGIVRLA